MIIQHNISALNSYNKLSNNNSSVSKNLSKLSSGYRINSAADDAAGLAISEKMRSQITGLDRAKLNAQDGISLVQTAEGALTEVHSMLNRLVELGTESANGTIQATDRQKIQDEVDALTDEIDRISQATNFNGINLLDGTLGGNEGVFSKVVGGNATFTTTDATQGSFASGDAIITAADLDEMLHTGDTVSVTFNYSVNGKESSFTASYKIRNGESGADAATQTEIQNNLMDQIKNSALSSYFNINGDGTAAFTLTAKEAGATTAVLNNVTGFKVVDGTQSAIADNTITPTPGTDAFTTIAGITAIDTTTMNASDIEKNIFEVNGKKFAYAATADDAAKMATDYKDVNVIVGDLGADDEAMAALITQKTGLKAAGDAGLVVYATGTGTGGNGLSLQIGDTAAEYNKVTVAVDDMSSNGLGINGLQVTDQGLSADSIARVNEAIEKVSVNRGKLGALQNRLEHTINNLATTSENMTSAESRIRDTDMAKEMMNFTKNNVLVQAAQSMLAQANQQPQQVLQLLR